MRNRLIISFLGGFLVLGLVLASCRKSSREPEGRAEREAVAGEQGPGVISPDTVYDPSAFDEVLAGRVSVTLREMFREELGSMSEVDRRFQLYKVNLDTDVSEEVFVRFMSPYFCGSGGCTLLLLDDDLSLITRFTVTRPPIFVEQTLKNNWKVLLVRSQKEWKELINEGDGYPGNPTVLPAAPYDAPSANAIVVFGDMGTDLPAMTYGF